MRTRNIGTVIICLLSWILLCGHVDCDPIDAPLLHRAVYEGHTLRVKYLLWRGVDPNLRNPKDGTTPLHHARTIEMAAVLLDRGADPNLTDVDGETPLFKMRSHKGRAALLISRGAEVNVRNRSGSSPLHLYEKLADVKELVAAGADLDARDARGMTPLNVNGPTYEKKIFLVEQGADPNIPTSYYGKNRTVLDLVLGQAGKNEDPEVDAKIRKLAALIRERGGLTYEELLASGYVETGRGIPGWSGLQQDRAQRLTLSADEMRAWFGKTTEEYLAERERDEPAR